MMDVSFKRLRVWLALAVAALTVILVSCGGGSSSGGGGGATAGAATVQGNVAAFSTASIHNPEGAQGILFRVASLLSQPATAQSSLDGINVSIGSRSALTNGAGQFTLTSVPPGSQVITFRRGNSSASAPIEVPANSVVTIVVVVAGNNASINSRNVNTPGAGNDNSPGGNTNSPGANTNTGGDNTNADGDNDNSAGNTNDDPDDDNDNDNSGNSGRG